MGDEINFLSAIFDERDGFNGFEGGFVAAKGEADDGAGFDGGMTKEGGNKRDVAAMNADRGEVMLKSLVGYLMDLGDSGVGGKEGVVDAGSKVGAREHGGGNPFHKMC